MLASSRSKVIVAGSGHGTAPQVISPADGGKRLDGLLYRIALWLHRFGVTPTFLTFASIAPALACAAAAALGYFYLATALLALSGICDLLDGPLARSTAQTSKFGALLDSTVDRLADAAPLLGLVAFYSTGPSSWASLVPAAALFCGYSVSYVRARAEGLSIALPPLWMRRPERMVLTGVAMLAAGTGVPGVAVQAPLMLLFLGVLAVLSAAASIHALIEAKRLLDGGQRG